MTIMTMAGLGGIFSLLSTSLGSLMVLGPYRLSRAREIRFSIDFVLGVMLSATAFSLLGPHLIHGFRNAALVQMLIAGATLGMIFIGFTHHLIQRFSKVQKSAQLMLVIALISHNFPEGMGAGASLAGMDLAQSIPIQIALSVQNVAEGLLMTMAMMVLGWSLPVAILAGIGSGVVEFGGALTAGFALERTMSLLPFCLALAGGAMLMSVVMELFEGWQEGREIKLAPLLTGFLIVPFLNLILGIR